MGRELGEEYLTVIERDLKQSEKDADRQREYILNSTARYHGNYVKTCFMPKLFSESEYKFFSDITDATYQILGKIIKRYFDDASYRERFGFDERIERLILRCDRRHLTVPIARIDMFYDEESKDFKFCEFNTDGTSAMNEDRELNNSVRDTRAFKEYAKGKRIRTCELFYSWISELEAMYGKRSGGALKNIAIADFMESASMEEFEVFRECFIRRGINAEICDLRDLSYDGRVLKTKSGMETRAVYRRAVTSDIIAHYDEIPGFIKAVEDGNALLFGDFFTQIAHDKILFKVMREDVTLDMLSKKERSFVIKHVPATFAFGERDIQDKDGWILKPEDSYGSRGIYPGISYSQGEWEEIIKSIEGPDSYILQEFHMPYRDYNYILEDGRLRKRQFYNLTGMYVYNGKLAGLYSRISKDPVISTQYNEMALPTVIVG